MKALLIDPTKETVQGIEVTNKDVGTVFENKTSHLPVSIGVYVLDAGNLVLFDEHEVIRKPGSYFLVDGFRRPVYGRGLVIGITTRGHVSTTLTARQVETKVKFQRLAEAAPTTRKHAVASAGYWFRWARKMQEEGKTADAFLCLENAYNHTEGALVALRRLHGLPLSEET